MSGVEGIFVTTRGKTRWVEHVRLTDNLCALGVTENTRLEEKET